MLTAAILVAVEASAGLPPLQWRAAASGQDTLCVCCHCTKSDIHKLYGCYSFFVPGKKRYSQKTGSCPRMQPIHQVLLLVSPTRPTMHFMVFVSSHIISVCASFSSAQGGMPLYFDPQSSLVCWRLSLLASMNNDPERRLRQSVSGQEGIYMDILTKTRQALSTALTVFLSCQNALCLSTSFHLRPVKTKALHSCCRIHISARNTKAQRSQAPINTKFTIDITDCHVCRHNKQHGCGQNIYNACAQQTHNQMCVRLVAQRAVRVQEKRSSNMSMYIICIHCCTNRIAALDDCIA